MARHLIYIFMLFVATAALADSPSPKIPPPDAAALNAATQLVNEAYKDDLANAITPQQQIELAHKLLQTGIETRNDPAGRFVLFTKAMDFADQAGDINTAFAAIDELNKAYQIDSLQRQADALEAIGKSVRSPDVLREVFEQSNALIDAAVEADRYDLARQIADMALTTARRVHDLDLIKQATMRSTDVEVCAAEFTKLKASLATLAKNHTDPDANLAVGRYRCFFKDDWDSGLLLLALGSDETLKALAAKEIAGANNVESQLALGDGWWNVAEKESGFAKFHLQRHAGKWYGNVAGALIGLAKIKVETRLKTIASVAPAKIINLLKIVDVARDGVEGKWEFHNNALLANGNNGQTRIEFLYQPPAEYDYKVVFSRLNGNQGIILHCWAMGHKFYAMFGGWHNTAIGFGMINGQHAPNNPTGRQSKGWLENGRQYTAIVKVRKDHVQAFLDGKLITEWKTDYSDMSPNNENWPMRRNNTIGIGAQNPAAFYSAEVIEITGKGQQLNPKNH